jgi:hypothetical protein
LYSFNIPRIPVFQLQSLLPEDKRTTHEENATEEDISLANEYFSSVCFGDETMREDYPEYPSEKYYGAASVDDDYLNNALCDLNNSTDNDVSFLSNELAKFGVAVRF